MGRRTNADKRSRRCAAQAVFFFLHSGAALWSHVWVVIVIIVEDPSLRPVARQHGSNHNTTGVMD